jgi:putative transposase
MVEDLNMRAMANKGFGNGKATMDNGFGVFQVMLAYKLKRKGGKLVVIDKWFPSSQLCNVCGYKNKKVKNLNVHSWICPVCGTEHDRDENAAINILIEGLRILYEEMEAA